jgi:hypothetical protein
MLAAQALSQDKCVLSPDGNDQAQTQNQTLEKNSSHHGHGFTRLDALGPSGFGRRWSFMVAGRAMVKQGQAGRY